MKKTILFLAFVFFVMNICNAQIRFSKKANIYNDRNEVIAQQYIAADIDEDGQGVMIIGKMMLKAYVTYSKRDDKNKITVYAVQLIASNGQSVGAAINKYDDGHYNILINYGDGQKRYGL